MRYPSVSVVVPSYNQARWLGLTLSSLVQQDYPPSKLQVIVMDGGSDDGSTRIIEQFREFLDYSRSEPDGGQADAIQSGMKRADGELVAWLNSDDMLTPSAVKSAARIFQRGHHAMCASSFHWSASHRTGAYVAPMAPSSKLLKIYGNYIAQPTCFWSKEVWDAVGGLRPHLQRYLDLDLHLRVIREGVSYHLSKRPRAVIVWHGQNKSGRADPREEREVLGFAKPTYAIGKAVWSASHVLNGNSGWLAKMATQRALGGKMVGLGVEVSRPRLERAVGARLVSELVCASSGV